PSEDRNGIAHLHGDVLLPASSRKHAGRIAFELPIGHLALLVLHVDKEVAVRVGPVDFGDHARQRDGLGGVILRAERMMRQQCRSQAAYGESQPPSFVNPSCHGSPRFLSLRHFGPCWRDSPVATWMSPNIT